MKHLGISGGGTKIGGLFGMAEVLLAEKSYRPDIISGISAGAILGLPLAMGKFDEIREWVLEYSLRDFFSQPPVKQNGRLTLRAYWNFLTGKPYLGKQENLPKTIAKVITPEVFGEYVSGNYPVCIVGAVDFIAGGRKYINLKEVDYETCLQAVNASASIPIYTEAVRLNGWYLFDGGVRDHIGTAWILKRYQGVTESVSLYSRPEDFQVLPEEFSDRNLLKILARYVDITNTEVSKNDEWMEDAICRERNIRQHKVFLPRVMDSVYDTDPGRLQQVYQAGRNEALEVLEGVGW